MTGLLSCIQVADAYMVGTTEKKYQKTLSNEIPAKFTGLYNPGIQLPKE